MLKIRSEKEYKLNTTKPTLMTDVNTNTGAMNTHSSEALAVCIKR
jgi:hypothetical protein